VIPPRSVLVAVDFSDSSRAALAFGARLARHTGAALHVLHAEDPLLAAAATQSGVDLALETREELSRFVQSVVPADARQVHDHVVVGSAVQTICNIAVREQLDVIVMGMHGMSGVERAMFGSTTEGVLKQAATSVLVVPDVWAPPRPDTPDLSGVGPVVAGIENAEPALAGAAAACRLARALGTPVELRHVVPDLPVPQRWRGHAASVVAQAIEQQRRELGSMLPMLGASTPVTLHVDTGRVAESLAHAVEPGEGRSPLLVLGRRNKPGPLGGPGATAYRVLTHARAPVLVYLPEA
jgi:nucleotide-binding universal stress UspA family protein